MNIERMNELSVSDKRLKEALDSHVEDLHKEIMALNQREHGLKERFDELKIAQANGNLDSTTASKSMLEGKS